MGPALFDVQEHVIPGQHVRGYHNALKTQQEDVLQLAVKSYKPKQSLTGPSRLPAVTIIAGHGNALCKEMYEPLWDDLLVAIRAQGGDIASIWFADNVHQGYSGILNEAKVGDDGSWFDHSRDLLTMTNHFRSEMPMPIIGIGHSYSCAQLVHLSIMHPRLLAALVFIEPVIQDEHPRKGGNSAKMAVLRPDLWPSRAAAEAPIRKARLFKSWDPRVLETYLAHSFRETPTALYPNEKGSVTLQTTKHNEAFTYTRFNPTPQGDEAADRLMDPDLVDHPGATSTLHRGEARIAMLALPHLLPSVFWMYGDKSALAPPDLIEYKLQKTGAGIGGSGGAAMDKVAQKVYTGGSHFLPFEKTTEVAGDIATWLAASALSRFVDEKNFWENYGTRTSKNNMLEVSDEYASTAKKPPGVQRPTKL